MTSIYKPSTEEYILYNNDLIKDPELFNNTLQSVALDNGSYHIRGQATFFDYAERSLVLKHYNRGGLMARFSRDKYLWTGLRQTRAFKEFYLLDAMKILNLPVPAPIAARVKRDTLFYSADLITQKVEKSTAFGESLKSNQAEESVWIAIGQLIHLFHRHGVYHSDLNANNILITDSQQLYLIDFDKSYFRMKSDRWMHKMIDRLRRSFYKIKKINPELNFSGRDWDLLMEGYKTSLKA